MDSSKIDAGVKDFLEHCQDSTRQFKGLACYIDALKVSADWSDPEIIELQTRAIRELLKRQGDPQ